MKTGQHTHSFPFSLILQPYDLDTTDVCFIVLVLLELSCHALLWHPCG